MTTRRIRQNEPDGPVPYALIPAGEAAAAHPDARNRDLWMALDAGEQPGPEAEREARRQSDAEAWGGRGPSASYAEWLAEGQAETEAEAVTSQGESIAAAVALVRSPSPASTQRPSANRRTG